MLQMLQKFADFFKIQLDNLLDFEKCCKTRIHLQRSAPIQPKMCQNLATTLRAVRKGMLKVRDGRAARRGGAAGGGRAANLARLLPKLAEFFVSSKNI